MLDWAELTMTHRNDLLNVNRDLEQTVAGATLNVTVRSANGVTSACAVRPMRDVYIRQL